MGMVRPPAVAGLFYPGGSAALAQAVDEYLAAARVPVLPNVRAVIAPHAGYIYSGPTAGYAFKSLQSGLASGRTTVYLLGPSHRSWFQGISTGDFDWRTPLGTVPMATEAVQALWALGARYRPMPEAHRDEHSLEVQLPFLLRVAPDLQLVPLLFGEVDPQVVGLDLAAQLRDQQDARVVVSSDLSHFNEYDTARRMDQSFLQQVLEGQAAAVERAQYGACGHTPIAALIKVAEELGWTPHLLDYRNSGDTAGDKMRVVGYAAVAYTETPRS